MSEQNFKNTDAATEAKLLTITSLNGDHETFNKVMDYLKDHRSQMTKVAQQLETSDLRGMDGLFGVNVKIEKDNKGNVTAIDFSHGGGGGGLGGFFSSVAHDVAGVAKSAVHGVADLAKSAGHAISHAAHTVSHEVSSHLKGLTEIALPELALVDDVAHTHLTTAVDDVLRGAANEVIHHPLTVLEDVGIGAAIAVTSVALPGSTLLWGAALGAGLFAGNEIIHHGIHAGAASLTDIENIGHAATSWAHDTEIVAGSGVYSAQQEASAQAGLESAGAFGAQFAAGAAGGIAGGIEAVLPYRRSGADNRRPTQFRLTQAMLLPD